MSGITEDQLDFKVLTQKAFEAQYELYGVFNSMRQEIEKLRGQLRACNELYTQDLHTSIDLRNRVQTQREMLAQINAFIKEPETFGPEDARLLSLRIEKVLGDDSNG